MSEEGAGPRAPRFTIRGTAFAAPPPAPGLYLVATPIGNLSDITLRALEILAGADVLACEDTRVTARLLQRFGIERKAIPYHEHNEAEAGERLLAALRDGRSVALVSDAGTPLVSDPGFRLVERAVDAELAVVPVPGPSAALTALVASGLASDAFFFAGFLPSRASARAKRLEELARVPSTLIVFESPNRVAESLADMAAALGPRPAAVCRELTKMHETIYRGTLDDLAQAFGQLERVRGEIVVCIGPPPPAAVADKADADTILIGLMAEMKPARAAQEAARLTGLSRRDLYQRALTLKESGR